MEDETLTDKQLKRIAYVEHLLGDFMNGIQEAGIEHNPNLDAPSYCAEMSRKIVLHEKL